MNNMKTKRIPSSSLSKEEIAVRKRYIGATFVTCVVLALVGGTIHVVQLGANRMAELKASGGYDREDPTKNIRAAGEDLFRNQQHEHKATHKITYTLDEAAALLPSKQWAVLEEAVTVPAGEFDMGTDNLKTDAQNRPAHTVYVPEFYIDKYPTTNAQYAQFVAQTDRRVPLNWVEGKFKPDKVLHPVTMVTWFDAKAYCEWAGKRLPTEAEWEKAARGNDGRRWPWGDVMDTKRLNNYYNVGKTTSVFTYDNGVSPYGVYDMAGNVQEWVFDSFEKYKDSDAPSVIFSAKKVVPSKDKEDRKAKMGSFINTDKKYKVMRGGSWKGDPFSASSYHRGYAWPNSTSDFFGFRCARDVQPKNI